MIAIGHLLSHTLHRGSLRSRTSTLARYASSSVGTYLPTTLSGIWTPQRDFAFLKLPTPGVSSVVAISGTSPQVMVCTSEGFFYVYGLNLETGGEGTLLKQYSLLEAGGSSSQDDTGGSQDRGNGGTTGGNGNGSGGGA